MSLADELDELIVSRRCDTCDWRESCTPDERERIDAKIRAFMAVDRKQRYGQFTDLYNVCRKYGLAATLDAFRHHCRSHVAN